MHIFSFVHTETESVLTIIAANREAAREKLKTKVADPSEWKLQ